MNGEAPRRLLLLGGIDPCGGAGITADVQVAALHHVVGLPIAVATTVQNRRGFIACHNLPPHEWRAALDAALDDGDVHAVKTGLLGDEATIRVVGEMLRPLARRVPIVVDPVLAATAGGYDAGAAIAAAIREHLAPLAAVITPNRPEAEVLFAVDAARAFAIGCRAVVQKGGHDGGELAVDVLSRPGEQDLRFTRRRLPVGPVHGTGCAFATALACWLATGADLATAAARAGDWLWARLASLGPPPGDGLPRPVPLAGALPITRTSLR